LEFGATGAKICFVNVYNLIDSSEYCAAQSGHKKKIKGWNEMTSARLADDTIEQITANRHPHDGPHGWHRWPEHPWFAYQFRRGLGETQEGGGSVSDVFQTAAQIIPGSLESWHAEWLVVADRNAARSATANEAGHIRTAMGPLRPSSAILA
jgi:hypothetical protein